MKTCIRCYEEFYGHGGNYCNGCYEQLPENEKAQELERRMAADSSLAQVARLSSIEGYATAQAYYQDGIILQGEDLQDETDAHVKSAIKDESITLEQRPYSAHGFIMGYNKFVRELEEEEEEKKS